jgi:hypothetical protein
VCPDPGAGAAARRAERREDAVAMLRSRGYGVEVDLSPAEREGVYLEGTGVLVPPRSSRPRSSRNRARFACAALPLQCKPPHMCFQGPRRHVALSAQRTAWGCRRPRAGRPTASAPPHAARRRPAPAGGDARPAAPHTPRRPGRQALDRVHLNLTLPGRCWTASTAWRT